MGLEAFTPTTALAHPQGADGPVFPGEVLLVDPSDPDIAALIEGDYLIPSDTDSGEVVSEPSEQWTKAALLDYAEAHSVDVSEGATKAEIVDAIAAAR